MTQLKGSVQAERTLRANLPPRYWKLDRLERYVDGTQYEGRPDWFNPQEDVPLLERKPAIVYPIVASAIRSNVDLIFGEGRFPDICCEAEESVAFDDRFSLSDTDRASLESFVRAVVKQARLASIARESLEAAQGCGSAVAIACIRNGRFAVETTRTKWCSVEFEPNNARRVARLEIRYPYLEQYRDERSQEWAVRCMLYRRVIDATSDVTFLPIEADESGQEPGKKDWRVDRSKSTDHGLGFCPVVWYRFLPKSTTVAEVDGHAIHENLLDEIDQLNFSLSQKHRAALYCSDPQFIETGVSKDENPSEMGRVARAVILTDEHGSRFGVQGPRPARKKGPGQVWRYEAEGSKAYMLCLPGDALKATEDNCRDLRSKIAEGLSVNFTDADNMRITADLSGRALRELHKRQLERCDAIRQDFGDNFLLPLIDIQLRMTTRLNAKTGVYIGGLANAAAVAGRFEQPVMAPDGTLYDEWFTPGLDLKWPLYFSPSDAEQRAIVENAVMLLKDGVITKRTAVGMVKDIAKVGNVDAYLVELEKESAQAAERAIKMMASRPPAPSTEESEVAA